MSDCRKEAEEKMAKAIFISGDCWLCVFELLPAYQLGLRISMISHRFDYYVDEHFKIRKWALAFIGIGSKIGKNGTNKMKIGNSRCKSLPIPQVQLPRKVIGFRLINITFIDRNTIAFLRHFRQLFAACQINLSINTYYNDRISAFILHNIWPMIAKNIRGMFLFENVFHRLRKFVPSILNDCPSLRIVCFGFCDLFAEFPADDNATASDGQAVAKWLFTPLQSNVPKIFKCWLDKDNANWSSNVEAIKAAFASTSSPANFIVNICFMSPFDDSVVPFDLTNELTHEQLTLKRINNSCRFLLIRCPIARDESKWTKWEEEAIGLRICNQRNHIAFHIYDESKIGDGLLDTTPGPSDQQQK